MELAMTNTWFRFHRDALNNPKVQRLSGDDFKGWVNVLCTADDDGKLPPIEDVSFALRETKEAVSSLFHTLSNNELIETDGETFRIHNWRKRQYKSDTSTERVKRWRNAKRNVSETPQKQNRTDTETEQKEPPVCPPSGDEPKVNGSRPKARRRKTSLPNNFPDTTAQDAAITFWQKQGREDLLDEIETEIDKFRDHCLANGKSYLDWNAAWRTWFRNAVKWAKPPPTATNGKTPWELEAEEENRKIREALDGIN